MLAGMLAIGGIGLVASLLLGIASKIFYVAVDPTILAITEALPGANCGGLWICRLFKLCKGHCKRKGKTGCLSCRGR